MLTVMDTVPSNSDCSTVLAEKVVSSTCDIPIHGDATPGAIVRFVCAQIFFPGAAVRACLRCSWLRRLDDVTTCVSRRGRYKALPELVMTPGEHLPYALRRHHTSAPLRHVTHTQLGFDDNVESLEYEVGGVIVCAFHPSVKVSLHSSELM